MPSNAREKKIVDYEATFGTDHGQRVLRDLMVQSGFFREHPKDDRDFHEGQRSAILYIFSMLDPNIKRRAMQPDKLIKEMDHAGTDYTHG